MATTMSDDERRAFLRSGTRTGALSTVRADGRLHVAPVWRTGSATPRPASCSCG